jgi:RNA polymerase sigma-70 factor (ECF subfamily)
MTTDSLDLNIVHRWDDSSLQLLYRHFYKALVAFAIQAVETQESAEEIVQDIFVKTWQKHNTFKSTATLKAYLYNGVRNECISHLRRQQTAQERIRQFEKDYHQLQMGTEESMAGSLPHREEAIRQLLLAIDSLPPKLRELFLLAIRGKSSEDIAQEMGITLQTVKKQRQRGLERLRKELGKKPMLLLAVLIS